MSGTTKNQTTTLTQQVYPSFPEVDFPIANPNGTITVPWQRLLLAMWLKLGGSNTASTARAITSVTTGSPVLPQNPSGSPFVFISQNFGTLVVGRNYSVDPVSGKRVLSDGSATIEISRNQGTTWFLAGLGQLAIPVLVSDQVRVSWSGPVSPVVNFLPVGSA